MRRGVSLVGAALCGVAVGAFLGADLHVDMTVPERVFVVADGRRLESGAHVERRPASRRDLTGVFYAGDGRFHVDRDGLRAAIDAPDPFFLAPMVRRDRDGEPDGFRLSGIPEGSLAWELGFRNGDIVRPPPRDAERSKPRPAEVLRRGAPVRLGYEVR
ncbi:MAG: hypothetical protein H6737_28885 [Alphaproteobacteria bacterium]|nr:hypothetical protein [Alphaproteobacteria bacterium]